MKPPRQPHVQLVNLGCAKNVVDSEEILGLLQEDGFALGAPGRKADVVIINTCGFLQSARKESLSAIRAAAARRRRGDVRRLVVIGCLAQRYREEIEAIPGVDAIVGPGQNRQAAVAARTALETREQIVSVAELPRHTWAAPRSRYLSTPPWTAYLKIAEGCDHPCTFCTIPGIRGGYVSKPFEDVITEARTLVDGGVLELNLVAQDTTRYGSDLPGRPDINDLLRALDSIDGVRMIRLFYAYPYRSVERVVETLAGLRYGCRYIDMPLQHSDPMILRSMKRPGSGDEYLGMLERMRACAPDLTVRTTLIVGFPGETDAAFEGLCRFVEMARFDRLGVFEYSAEEGTPAAMMDQRVPAVECRRRRDEIMRLQQDISLERNRSWVGRELEVLVESRRGRDAVGRSYRDGPDVDGVVIIGNSSALPGTFVRVRLTDADVYDLHGTEVHTEALAVPMEATL